MKDYVTTKELADMSGFKWLTIMSNLKRGTIAAERFSNRWAIPLTEALKFVEYAKSYKRGWKWTPPPEGWVSVDDVAAKAGLSRERICQFVRDGTLPSRRFNRRRCIKEEDGEEFYQRRAAQLALRQDKALCNQAEK